MSLTSPVALLAVGGEVTIRSGREPAHLISIAEDATRIAARMRTPEGQGPARDRAIGCRGAAVHHGRPHPVILAAILALLANSIIQAYVVPRAQARIRRQERREADLIELSALLDDTLERAVSRFRGAVISQRHWIMSIEEAEKEGKKASRGSRSISEGKPRHAEDQAHRGTGGGELPGVRPPGLVAAPRSRVV